MRKEDFQNSINGLEVGIKRKSLNSFDIGECFGWETLKLGVTEC